MLSLTVVSHYIRSPQFPVFYDVIVKKQPHLNLEKIDRVKAWSLLLFYHVLRPNVCTSVTFLVVMCYLLFSKIIEEKNIDIGMDIDDN